MTFDTITIVLIVAVVAGLAIMLLGLRAKRKPPRVDRRADGESPYVASQDRPYMKPPPASVDGPQGNSVVDEVATAATDVAGEMLGVKARPVATGGTDDLTRLKGVGPKFAARLIELGFTRYTQLAGMNETEIGHLDERVGAFQGRLVRDRIVEQADYLARGDVEGFQERFGNLGS
jgi:predicted flap endonuclease-1-like 5' DNA nuclease